MKVQQGPPSGRSRSCSRDCIRARMRLAHGARLGATSHPRVRAVPQWRIRRLGGHGHSGHHLAAAHLSPPVPGGGRGSQGAAEGKAEADLRLTTTTWTSLYTELTRPMASQNGRKGRAEYSKFDQ